jgi:hypothetical protein
MPTDPMLKEVARQALYRLAPDRWVARVLGMTPDPWQVTLLRTPPGSQLIALTGRQAGKTQAACWAAGHVAVFELGALSVVACPSQRQSAEAVRRVKAALVKAGVKLKGDNVFAVETVAGARILALPGDESTSRGLSVDGVIIADEAARLSPEMISALRPMRARFAETARFMMLSTAWSRSDPFWQVWESDDPSWVRIRSLADNNPRYSKAFLDGELANLGETIFRREYLGEPLGHGASPFDWGLYDQATSRHEPKVPPGEAFIPLAETVRSVGNPFRDLQQP